LSHLGSCSQKFAVLYEDSKLIIVDKPVDSIVHGTKQDANTLLEIVRRYLAVESGGEVPFLAPSNRLDRNTSGPVVFAKTRETAIVLRHLFTQCKINKIYSARLTGILPGPVFIEADIIKGRHKRAKVENMVCTTENFPDKEQWFAERLQNSNTISATIIMPIECAEGATLAEILPWTGRYHQIRVICQAIGFPVCGDKKYNRVPGMDRIKSKRDQFSIQSLLCRKLEIEDLGISVESSWRIASKF
jgi:23S rRNA pseudouridine955/2504/2580 synthase